MDKIVQDLSLPNLVSALEANINAQLPLMYAHMPQVQVINEPDTLGMMTDLPELTLNAVYRTTFPKEPEQAEAKIEQVLRRYRSQHCLPMMWIVTSSTQPSDLGKYLEARQFTRINRTPGMVADLSALDERLPAPVNLVIERVHDVDQLKQWLHPVTVAFELSETVASTFFELFAGQGFGSNVPWQLFVGTVNGQPVAASRLFCAAGVAGIYHVATVPEARGQGLGTTTTLAAARAGRELGYRIGGLVSSSEGYGVYCRLGFQECCHADIYMSPTDAMPA